MDVNRALQSVRHRFDGQVNTHDLIARVGDLLPLDTENYKVLHVKGTPARFKADINIKINSVDSFLESYCSFTGETLRPKTVEKQGPNSEFDIIYPYRCQHKTFHQNSMNAAERMRQRPSKRLQNTDCQFRLP